MVGKRRQYLRFTLFLWFDDPTLGEPGVEIAGCLASRRKDGIIEVRPPRSERTYQSNIKFTPDLMALVSNYLQHSEYSSWLKYEPMHRLPGRPTLEDLEPVRVEL